jgi:hypothetical protein
MALLRFRGDIEILHVMQYISLLFIRFLAAMSKPLQRLAPVSLILKSISDGVRGLLLALRLRFSFHSRIPPDEGLPYLVIEYLRPHLE